MVCTIKNKQITDLIDVPDGTYLVKMISDDNTLENYRRHYFFILDEVAKITGDNKGTLHNRIKDANGINSTLSFNKADWCDFLAKTKEYFYQKLDLVF
jgi:hypothetical protein